MDYVLEQMKKNKAVLRFVSKNLSWGVFRAAIEQKEEAAGVKNLLEELLAECCLLYTSDAADDQAPV